MWAEVTTYIYAALAVIVALLTYRVWGDSVYVVSRNWRLVSFVFIATLCATLLVLEQERFKYNLVFHYFTGQEPPPAEETRYHIRQCAEFVKAKRSGEEVAEYRPVSAGPISISKISYWDFCARTFGMNYWKFDISIDGQNGGRLLCDTYALDTYRSPNVQSWCDTVFAPRTETSVMFFDFIEDRRRI